MYHLVSYASTNAAGSMVQLSWTRKCYSGVAGVDWTNAESSKREKRGLLRNPFGIERRATSFSKVNVYYTPSTESSASEVIVTASRSFPSKHATFHRWFFSFSHSKTSLLPRLANNFPRVSSASWQHCVAIPQKPPHSNSSVRRDRQPHLGFVL